MKTRLKSTVLCISLLGLVFLTFNCAEEQPDKSAKHWYKGNLHAHSYWSDGKEFPEMIMDWYKTNDYHFTVLSDHNVLAEGEKWKTISEQEHLQKGFQDYLKKYGEEWVDYKTDSVGRLMVKLKTYEEYSPLFEEEERFLILPSEEISMEYEKNQIHINATNIQKKIEPNGGNSTVEVIQTSINAILKQSRETNTPILPHINHPNFHYSITVDDFVQLKNVHFFEVYNGHPLVNNEGDSTHISIEKMWDLINIAYSEKNQPLLFGVATDDSHHYLTLNKEASNPGRGWVMVKTDSLRAPNLIEAMKKGDFYGSTGVVLKEMSFQDNLLNIEVEQVQETDYEIQFIGAMSDTKEVKIISTVKGTKAEFELTKDYMFVRAKILSDRTNKNFFDETEFEKAWTQPVVYKMK